MEYTAKDIGDILEAVSNTVPDLITKLLRTLYSEDSASEMGRAVGTLYKELVEAGIPKDAALKMTSDYMFSLKDIMRNVTVTQNMNGKDWPHS